MPESTFFDKRMKLQRALQSSDSRGGWSVTDWELVAQFDASLQPNSEEWALEYSKLGRDTTHRLYCDTMQSGVDMTAVPRDEDNTYRIVDEGVTRYL